MATTKDANEVGIIGQMYEERKSKKVGVLESREPKYKTLMLRDKDGKSFNITYSTFRSNWRKYQGEEVIQTSTQVEEEKVEEKAKVSKSKKVVATKTSEPKISTEEKVKRLRALDELINSKIKEHNLDKVRTERTSKGGLKVCYKKSTMFEVWDVIKLDKYSFRMKEKFDSCMETQATREYLEKGGGNPIRYRVDAGEFEQTLDDVLNAAEKWIEIKKNEKNEKKEEK